MSKAPISVCLIVRDEAASLPACLESVVRVCREIIVVDTGSTDGTPAIAARLGARVFSFPWIDDFSAARNFAAAQASQPFIFRLDADERLVEKSLPALLAYCRSRPTAAGRVTRRNVYDNATDATVERLTALYPNRPEYRYERRIHEQLRFRGAAPTTVETGVVLLHTGYKPEILAAKDKAQRNLRLLELDLADNPSDPYLHYQVGQTRYALKQHADAIASFNQALQLLMGRPPAEVPYLPTIFLQQAYCFVHLRDLGSALQTISVGVDLFPDFTDLYFVYGVALMELGGPDSLADLRAAFEHCLALGEPDPARYHTVAGVGSFRAWHNLGVFHEASGDLAAARRYYQQAAATGFGPARQRLEALAAPASARAA